MDEPKYWTFALEDSPENLTIAIWTVGLRETPTSEPNFTKEQAQRSVEYASDIWEANCGIRFVHAGHSEIVPADMGIPYLAEEFQDGNELGSAIYTPNFISVGYVPANRLYRRKWNA